MKTQKNLKGVERMEVLIASHVNFFLCNKYNSYNILLKIQKSLLLEMKEERFSEAYLEPTEISTMELF